MRCMTEISKIQTFEVSEKRLTQWKSGQLVRDWAAQFPKLFDELDVSHAVSVCGKGKLFWEWLATILLHQATGYFRWLRSMRRQAINGSGEFLSTCLIKMYAIT